MTSKQDRDGIEYLVQFRRGHDTATLAIMYRVSEAEIYNMLARIRGHLEQVRDDK